MSDDRSGRRRADPTAYHPGELGDDVDLLALVRRYERFTVDIDQRLKDIEALLRQDRRALDERIEQLEHDVSSLRVKRRK